MWFFHVVFIVVAVAVAYVIRKGIRTDKMVKIVASTLFAILIVMCMLHVFDGTVFAPTGDQYYLCDHARLFLTGEFEGLQKGGYLEEYPHQLGLTLFYELITRLAGSHLYMALISINMIAVILTGVIGYRLCAGRKEKVNSVFFSVLLVLFLPVYFYISFVYGECLSVFFSMLFVWQCTEYVRTKKIRSLVILCIASGVAVMCKGIVQLV